MKLPLSCFNLKHLLESQNTYESSGIDGFAFAFALRVEVRLLSQADSPRPLPLPQICLTDIIWRRRVVNTAIIPDGKIIDVGPSVADLQVMILDDQADKPVQEVLGLVI